MKLKEKLNLYDFEFYIQHQENSAENRIKLIEYFYNTKIDKIQDLSISVINNMLNKITDLFQPYNEIDKRPVKKINVIRLNGKDYKICVTLSSYHIVMMEMLFSSDKNEFEKLKSVVSLLLVNNTESIKDFETEVSEVYDILPFIDFEVYLDILAFFFSKYDEYKTYIGVVSNLLKTIRKHKKENDQNENVKIRKNYSSFNAMVVSFTSENISAYYQILKEDYQVFIRFVLEKLGDELSKLESDEQEKLNNKEQQKEIQNGKSKIKK